MEEAENINAWIGKAPEKEAIVQSDQEMNDATRDHESSVASPSTPTSSNDSDLVEIPYQPSLPNVIAIDDEDLDELQRDDEDGGDDDMETEVSFTRQENLTIDLPELDEDEQDEYEYLPGHFHVRKVLVALPNHKYLVRLASGEVDLVERTELTSQLHNGKLALNEYNKLRFQRSARRPMQPRLLPSGSIDWQRLAYTDSEPEVEESARKRRKTCFEDEVSDVEQAASSGDDFQDSDDMRPQGRRSTRLAPKLRLKYVQKKVREVFSSDDGTPKRRPGRPSRQAIKAQEKASKNRRQLRAQRAASSEERSEREAGARRSERTRQHTRRNMRERQEDELSSQSEKDQGPKVVATKEVFFKIAPTDPFRRRHQQECATCFHTGDNDVKGPLVFCQGCSNSYHKQCLGNRGSRDHLVTKVGDNLFVLQCRRCIGVAREKDQSAPHYGRCTGCDKLGTLSKSLRRRLTTRQEQVQREENGGIDPITITQPNTINKVENVMFRCATCSRAWHMHHLPNRKTAHSQPGDSDEEGLDQETIAQKRFELYHRSWICKDCVENQHTVDTLVAWRPVDQESYVPGTTLDKLPESKKEYLLKWRNQSYLRCTWMPGTWVWGIVTSVTKVSFNRKPENQLPRMTIKDAIPEDFHRVDIVFDVRYTSVVRNSSEGIDMARVKEVDTAYVKYKGLGYEDAIWEKPPSYSDTERFMDFKEAYEDFVKKRYMSIPPQSTLRRALVHARSQDFETKLIKKTQPAIMTGGQMMQYQLEGHNWLYYQWYRQHNAILADEMGLGKTIQLIALIATLIQQYKCWPFLVVVPNSTCPNWRREIKKWIPSIRAVCYYGSSASRKLMHDYELFPKDPDEEPDKKKRPEAKDIKAHIVIASYESIIEKHTALSLQRVPWQGLIVDEGQRLKNDKNLVYEGLAKYRFPFKVLMTGTPLQNNARELFNLLQFLDKDKHNAAQLEAKYAELTQENVPELHEMLKPYFLRRTKVQVLTFLPPMSQIIVPVSMSALQRKVSKSVMSQNPQLMKSIFSRDGTVAVKERANLNNILMQLRKTLCHPFVYSREIEDRSVDSDTSFKRLVEASSKLQLLSIMLPKLKERGHRVLMFSQFLDNLDIVEDFLDGLGMLHRRLDGTINALEKQKRIDEFNAPDSPYFAFLLSTRAGGVGINLATADTVIILDPDFNPHQDIQALSRAHRIGQQNKVLVFQLMTRDSPEEKIMQIGKKKMALDHVLIEAMDQDDEAGMDLESILRHGAAALFDDDKSAEETIVYNETSVDKLLDRSQIESTKTSDNQSAESQFSFARIWANDKATLEEGLKESEDSGTNTPNPDTWDKILKERERAYQEEAARKAEELGRGKRRRGQVDYGGKPDRDINAVLGIDSSPVQKGPKGSGDDESSISGDEDFQAVEVETDVDPTTVGEETEPEMQTITARPYKRAKVPTGQAPHFNGDIPVSLATPSAANNYTDYTAIPVPPNHKCSACNEEHPMGWCRLKIAGVEHCGLCGLAHMGHGRTCPHLNDEKQVETLLLTLKESTESRQLIDEAVRYLRGIRAELVGQRRQKERKMAAEQERRALAATPQGTNATAAAANGVPIKSNMPVVNGYGRVSVGVNAGDARPAQPQQQQRVRPMNQPV